MKTQEIIESWYKALNFPKKYDAEFYDALNTITIPENLTIDTYDVEEQDGKRNFLAYLYFCEALKKQYASLGISESVLLDTVYDIRRWLDTWSMVKGELYLGELLWLSFHMRGTLFHLGTLQFAMGKSHYDCPEKGLAKGDRVIEVHIPAGTDLSKEAVDASFATAKAFFAEHFPEYEYRYFTCHSWMLGSTLNELLNPESKILAFQKRFDVVHEDKSEDIIRFVFRWDATREALTSLEATTGLMRRVKERALAGETFYSSLGVIDKNSI